MSNPLQQAFDEILNILEHEKIDYALIGGLAATVRGRTRVTDDIDLVVSLDPDSAMDFARNLDAESFEPLFSEFEQVVRSAFLLPLRHRKTGITLDLAIGVSGLEQQVIARATLVDIGDREIFVATASDLIVMKTLAGRPQDDIDIKGIIATQGVAIDWDYCEEVAKQLQQAVAIDLVDKIRELRTQT